MRIREPSSRPAKKSVSLNWLWLLGLLMAAAAGYGIGYQKWRQDHARAIESLSEHLINAKAELEAGNRQACADELARITSDFQKLY